MEGKRWREIRGERIDCGRGVRRRVGRRGERVRIAGQERVRWFFDGGAIGGGRYGVLFPSCTVRSSGGLFPSVLLAFGAVPAKKIS